MALWGPHHPRVLPSNDEEMERRLFNRLAQAIFLIGWACLMVVASIAVHYWPGWAVIAIGPFSLWIGAHIVRIDRR